MKWAYYNENNPCDVQWLRHLIEAGAIAPGIVDDRSITDVQPEDLREFRQVHLFAGIGGWSYALRLAGWPDDHPIWTGSAPCQPFSVAGRQKGKNDNRHLWPEMFRLLSELRPAIAFGEQVASPAGREWLSGVRTDMESVGYAVGAADLPAASVGAPHIRQRLYWGAVRLGDSVGEGLEGFSGAGNFRNESGWELPGQVGGSAPPPGVSAPQRMGDAYGLGCERHDNKPGELQPSTGHAPAQGLAHNNDLSLHGAGYGSGDDGGWIREEEKLRRVAATGLADSNRDSARSGDKRAAEGQRESHGGNSGERGFWSDYYLVPFPGGECRRVESGSYPLDHGLPPRVGRDCTGTEGIAKVSRKAFIEGLGNAIVPQLAAEYVKTFVEAIWKVSEFNY